MLCEKNRSPSVYALEKLVTVLPNQNIALADFHVKVCVDQLRYFLVKAREVAAIERNLQHTTKRNFGLCKNRSTDIPYVHLVDQKRVVLSLSIPGVAPAHTTAANAQ